MCKRQSLKGGNSVLLRCRFGSEVTYMLFMYMEDTVYVLLLQSIPFVTRQNACNKSRDHAYAWCTITHGQKQMNDSIQAQRHWQSCFR